ncbi:tumor protein D54-like isoform X1 [Ctenocephalides felis]|uniref:tumor protein D54-like isoform X1 n=1 Tax=Ctenocephalides felis TaxID=7515 RepID=UPI000E6E546B|nr:tumor protein D54-like isoform X1 [Ctenocephalides felis]
MNKIEMAEAASPSTEMPHSGGEPGTPMGSVVGASGELAGLSPEEAELKRAEWSQELARVEEEIGTLRTVLASKVRRSGELKAKLGITVWKELTGDVNQSLRTVKESQVYGNIENCIGQISKAVTSAPIYQKTELVLKSTAEKTTSLLGGITGGLTSKIGQMRNSESFKSLEEKMGSAYENVKTKVSSSRSNSIQNFDEALREANKTPATTPTIPENSIIKQ